MERQVGLGHLYAGLIYIGGETGRSGGSRLCTSSVLSSRFLASPTSGSRGPLQDICVAPS